MNVQAPSNLYNGKVAKGITMFTELIRAVWERMDKARWSNDSNEEIGFYREDKIIKSSIFFGIWFEAWAHFDIPVCITLYYGGNAARDKYQAIKKILENKKEQGLFFKEDYQGYAVILFEHSYYTFEEQKDEERLLKLIHELRYMLEIK